MESHAEFLRRVSLDDGLVQAIREDFENADLSVADKCMLRFARRLTIGADKLGRGDVEELRSVGFDDRAILQIAAIAAWFNYVNRMADALGVGRD